MVKLRVSVGGSYTDLAVINCNDELHPIEIDSQEFKGRFMVRIKDFVGITNDGSEPILNSEYFKGHNRRFSIQVEGRFKQEWHGDQVYFGTDFDRSVDLPDGFDMMFKVAQYIDPVVKTSLTKDGKPWILSPLVSSINTMAAWRPQDANLPSPPLTPRHSAEHLRPTDGGSGSNMWGFLGKLKRGKRSSVMSVGSSTSQNDIYGSHGASANNSSDVIQQGVSIEGSRSTDESLAASTSVLSISDPNVGTHSASASTSGTSTDWASSSPTSITGGDLPAATEMQDGEEDMPLGQWRQHLEEDTTFFMPDKPTQSTTQRRKYFQSEKHRQDFVYQKDLVHGFEFFSPHMDFNTFNIKLGLSMNIRKYLAGQPVRYSCRTLDGNTVFWAVQFELVD